MTNWLDRFVTESNMIEGILREPLEREIKAHEHFLEKASITLSDLVHFVCVIQPGAILRNKVGFDVQVADHVPPAGGPFVQDALESLLSNMQGITPDKIHWDYEHLHPFTDGNGRSGRALWLWQMIHGTDKMRVQARSMGFLRMFYYQTLAA